jgi:outer membrane protein TolC
MFKNNFFTHKSAKYIFLSIVTLTSTLSYAEHRKHSRVIQQNINLQNYSIFKPINIDEISKIAIRNRQDLESFEYLIEANWHAERAALGAFLPQITIVADSGKSSVEELSGISQYPRESITLDINQLIFSLGGPKIKYQMAKEDTQISIAQKETLKNSIRFGAEVDFLTLKKELLRKELIEILDDSSKLTFDQYKTREKTGFLNKAQWANSQATFSKDQNSVINYPSNVDIAPTCRLIQILYL